MLHCNDESKSKFTQQNIWRKEEKKKTTRHNYVKGCSFFFASVHQPTHRSSHDKRGYVDLSRQDAHLLRWVFSTLRRVLQHNIELISQNFVERFVVYTKRGPKRSPSTGTKLRHGRRGEPPPCRCNTQKTLHPRDNTYSLQLWRRATASAASRDATRCGHRELAFCRGLEPVSPRPTRRSLYGQTTSSTTLPWTSSALSLVGCHLADNEPFATMCSRAES